MPKPTFPESFYLRCEQLYDTGFSTSWIAIGKQALADLELEYNDPKRLSTAVQGRITHRDSYRAVKEAKKQALPPLPDRSERLATVHPFLKQQCDTLGMPIEKTDRYWVKTDEVSILTVVEKEGAIDWDARLQEYVEQTKAYAPRYPTLDRSPYPDGHLLVISPTDIHIGKLASAFETGEEYNNQIAVRRALEGVRGIVRKVQGYHIDKVLFVIGNDILHIDTPKRTTTGGTSQDTDGQWYNNFLIAKQLYIDIIELLMVVADVHVQYDPSNHDFTNGFFLANTLSSWFNRAENVSFDVDISHRKYFPYYSNLIGTTHGDGAKTGDLALLMAHEEPIMWGQCKNRYFYTGHLHHKVSKDYMSVCVETLRSPSATDGWHHRNGYQHAPQAIEGFLHSKDHGQVARITHLF